MVRLLIGIGYVGLTRAELKHMQVELQKNKNLLLEEKNKQSAGNHVLLL